MMAAARVILRPRCVRSFVLSNLFKSRDRGSAQLSRGDKEAIDQERAAFADAARQTTAVFEKTRAALLRAGGATLDHPPGYEDRWEKAIRRLVQQGELREKVEYAKFPGPPTYQYTLTPRGLDAASALAPVGDLPAGATGP